MESKRGQKVYQGVVLMTEQQRVDRLNKNGYTCFHLFGRWYWCRVYSKNYIKIPLYWFHKI